MLFFGKKKEEAKPPPVEEVERMSRLGMSDKEIVKYLKAQGYAFPEIEKAMMAAVKKGVGEEPPAEPLTAAPARAPQGAPRMDFEMPELQEQPPALEDELGIAEPEVDINPEVIVEELVEGVVQEKWQKFDERVTKLEDELSRLRSDLQQSSHRFESLRHEGGRESEGRVQELSEQLEELQARVGGLEKAFKQFLPALTKNIESLSQMIHEMKEKKGVVEA